MDDLNFSQKFSSGMGDVLATRFLRADGGVVKLAGGGMPSSPVVGWRDRVAAMPTVSRTQNSTNPIGAMISGAAPTVAAQLAKSGVKKLFSQDPAPVQNGPTNPMVTPENAPVPTEGPSGAPSASPEVPASVPGDGSPASTVMAEEAAKDGTSAASDAAATSASDAAATSASDAAATAASDAAATAAADAAATAATEAGVTAAAEAGATAAVEGVAAVNAWNPVGWVLGGLALAGAMSRADGGMIEGEGTETSDSIATEVPEGSYILNAGAVKMLDGKALDALNKEGASKQESSGVRMIPVRLSDGEFELNPGAVKMIGKSKLDVINRKGLKFRDDNLAKKGV